MASHEQDASRGLQLPDNPVNNPAADNESRDLINSLASQGTLSSSNVVADESNLLHFQQRKMLQENELKQLRQQVDQLTEALQDIESSEKKHIEQINYLKEEIREYQRSSKREDFATEKANLTYLKNVIVKYMETNDHEVVPLSTSLFFISSFNLFNRNMLNRLCTQ